MSQVKFRSEHDSMGALQVPKEALYGAQTQRAVENFPISGLRLPREMIRALGLLKHACAQANFDLGLLNQDRCGSIQKAALEVASGQHDAHFPVDIFQTGSGTSSNMNCNEVVAHLASGYGNETVHPNDHVNMSQSSNDVFPSSIHIAAVLALHEQLLPALVQLAEVIEARADELKGKVKTGRTHLMDAMPVRMDQELGGWAAQIRHGIDRIEASLPRLLEIASGGTAVGTGINAHVEFGSRVARVLAAESGFPFVTMENPFEALSCQDAAAEMSGQLKVVAISLMKIANDLRWMNSGPLAGLGEIALPVLQPGSSIMPGKVNPVVPEAICMLAAQVMGNDSAITVGAQAGNFQLNVMLPMIAYNLLQSITLLANGSRVLAEKAIAGFTVNDDNLSHALECNPILVTALNGVIGYEKGAAIAKQAYRENRPVLEVALENTDLSELELKRLLDPAKLTQGGL
ncbi:MAG: class II fumarate hydratase [Gammaproteobacteria bacterium]|nr:class II fumarate hydratase [Gammaproteobacteria bacterium]